MQLAEVDSTSAPVYAPMIGREFELKTDLLARGVKSDYPSPEIAYITIVSPPGARNRFLVDLGRVPAGRRFRIVGVVTRTSRIFPSTEYVIAFADHSFAGMDDTTIRLNDVSGWHLYVTPVPPGQAPQLSEEYFRPLADRAP